MFVCVCLQNKPLPPGFIGGIWPDIHIWGGDEGEIRDKTGSDGQTGGMREEVGRKMLCI